jgi:hypothetical protein
MSARCRIISASTLVGISVRGLILVPQELSIGKAIENILVICEACNQDDIENKICLLPSLVMYGF